MLRSKKFIPIFLCIVMVFTTVAIWLVVVVEKNKTKNYFYKELDLPMIYINTENNQVIASKEDYLSCNVTITNSQPEYEFENFEAKIRGRGNYSWKYYDKKPYRLKFEDKVDLFGNGAAKTWTLIANAEDATMIRNFLAYNIGNIFDNLEFTSSTQFVELYVNNEYRGVYLVCEQVQTGNNRVDISESMDTVDTGYLLEMDSHAGEEGEIEGYDYFVCEDKKFALKTPDTEDDSYNEDYLNFIKTYFESCFDALKDDDFSTIEQLIDVDSFVDSYIINELFKNKDVNGSSFYLYKDAGGKLKSGPIWDFASIQYDDDLIATTNVFRIEKNPKYPV